MQYLDPTLFTDAAIPDETKQLNAGIIALTKDMANWWEVGAQKVRDARAKGEGVFPAPVKSERARWIEIDGPAGKVKLRVVPPANGAPRGVYLHIHGGGHVLGAADIYPGACHGFIAFPNTQAAQSVKNQIAFLNAALA